VRTDYALRSKSTVLCQIIGLDLSSGIKEIGGEHMVTGCAMSDARKIIYKGKYWHMLFIAPFRLLTLVLEPFWCQYFFSVRAFSSVSTFLVPEPF
jgi:hypothetical protein